MAAPDGVTVDMMSLCEVGGISDRRRRLMPTCVLLTC